jgi:hypothetical protein
MSTSLQDSLSQRTVRTITGCLEWTGYASRRGYGQITIKGLPVGTHRLAWELAKGPIPDGLCVCHSCDNPPCCNVEHLFLGTHAANAADRSAKGRSKGQSLTCCVHGHPFNEANTYIRPDGTRQCRACNKAAVARYQARKSA